MRTVAKKVSLGGKLLGLIFWGFRSEGGEVSVSTWFKGKPGSRMGEGCMNLLFLQEAFLVECGSRKGCGLVDLTLPTVKPLDLVEGGYHTSV